MKITVESRKDVPKFKKGNLYSGPNGIIVLCTEDSDNSIIFSGVCITEGMTHTTFSDLSGEWDADVFEPFYGKITLEQ